MDLRLNQSNSIFNKTVDKPKARIISSLIYITWGIYLLVMLSGILSNDRSLVLFTLIGCILLIVPFILMKQGYLWLSSVVVVLGAIVTVTLIASVGQGIRDVALIAIPIIFIFAGITLDRLYFGICVGSSLLIVIGLGLSEIAGVYVPRPLIGDQSTLITVLMVSLLLILAAVAVNLLATNMRNNLSLAQFEVLQLKQIDEKVREKEVQFRNLADSGTALIWTSGLDKLCNYFNQPWLSFTGRTLEQEMGNGWVEGVHPEDLDRCFDTYVTAFDKQQRFDMQYRLRHFSGEYRWIQDMGTPNYNSNGEFVGYIGHCFDITERKQIEEDLKLKTEELDRYFNTSLDLFCIADTDGFFRRLNPQWQSSLGYYLTELEGKKFLDFVHPDDLESTISAMSTLSDGETILNFENRYRCKDGSYRWIEWRSIPAGKLIYAAARDITERKHMEEQLRFQSTHDSMTGLYNRNFFEEELTRFDRGRYNPISIIITDVDGLKYTNDTIGHAAGDELLRNTAKVLSSVLRADDILARIGGDEFAVLLPETSSEKASSIIARVRKQLIEHNRSHQNLPVQLSIGSATGTSGNLTGLFTLADKRMYEDKLLRKVGADN